MPLGILINIKLVGIIVSVHGVRKLFQKRWSVFERASLPHE
jgi:hypothetical protein